MAALTNFLVVSLACSASALVASGKAGSPQVQPKDCGPLASAFEKAREGDRGGVTQLMSAVCSMNSLGPPQRARCQRMTTGLLNDMEDHNGALPKKADSSQLCTIFWNAMETA